MSYLAKLYILSQLCSGADESAVGTCADLVFAPIDASFSDDTPLLPSGFRIIPLDFVSVRPFVPLSDSVISFFLLRPN